MRQRTRGHAAHTGTGNRYLLAMGLAIVVAACGRQEQAPRGDGAARPPGEGQPGCDTAAARSVVETFGERLKNISLLAPDSIVIAELRANYSGLVTEHLLDGWLFRPETAPGREASSPWPERIEIDSITTEGAGSCRVRGKIVYLTSMEATQGGVAAVRPVALMVQEVDGNGWQISSYEVTTPARGVSGAAPGTNSPGANAPGTGPPATTPGAQPAPGMPAPPPQSTRTTTSPNDSDSTSPAAAAEVIRRYYTDINAREYRRAYELWGEGGRASGKSYQEFAAGFAKTDGVEVETGDPSRVEGAAGSRFVKVPVVIRAVLTNGTRQRFQGTYTLRRVVVDGAPPAERRWHIYSAEIEPT